MSGIRVCSDLLMGFCFYYNKDLLNRQKVKKECSSYAFICKEYVAKQLPGLPVYFNITFIRQEKKQCINGEACRASPTCF